MRSPAFPGEDGVSAPRTRPTSRGPPRARTCATSRGDAEQVWLLGLTGEFLGYLIPDFDYELDPGLPYIVEAPGDHCEETNSVGERGWPVVRRVLTELLAWRP